MNSVNSKSVDNYNLLFWGMILFAVLIGIAFILMRVVDADEGFYLSAGSLFASGLHPYLDFFYPQAPYLPVLLAPFASLNLDGLFLARAVGFISHILISLIMFYFAGKVFDDKKFKLVVLFVVLFSGPLLTFNSLAKPYFGSNLSFVTAFVLLMLMIKQRRLDYRILIYIFALLALACNFRSIFIIAAPLFFFLSFFCFKSLPNYKSSHFFGVILAAIIIPSIYSFYLLFLNPDFFMFNNLGFHLLRGGAPSFWAIILVKLQVMGKILIQPHYLIPMLMAGWSLYLINSRKYGRQYNSWHRAVFHLSLIIAALIWTAYLIPHPINMHYFHQTLIFLIIASFPAIKYILGMRKRIRIALFTVYLVAFALYPALYIFDVRDRHVAYDLDHVRQVTEEIKDNSAENDIVLSEWVGYNVFADRRQVMSDGYSGFQYDFGSAMVPYSKYRILTDEKINEILRNRDAKLVVINNYIIPEWKKELENNYDLLVKIGVTFIYERKTDNPLS